MSQSAINAAITETLQTIGHCLPESGEIVTHALVVVATTRYDDNGRRMTVLHRMYPTGEMDAFVEAGLLHSAIKDNDRERAEGGV